MIPKEYEKVATIACVNKIIAFPELALSGYNCDEGCEMYQSKDYKDCQGL